LKNYFINICEILRCAQNDRVTVIREIRVNQKFRIAPNRKEPCHLGQDSFTRTLYENEKITFVYYYMIKVPPVFP